MAYKLYNGDGTIFDPPVIDSYKQMVESRFPECRFGLSYQCMFCCKCPHGEYFKWPEDCIPIVELQELAEKHYTNQHNILGFKNLYLEDKEI